MTGAMDIKSTRLPRIGIVDNWHPSWNRVQSSFAKPLAGTRSLLQPDGWLPARENLLVAFIDEEVAGHVCFRIEPNQSIEKGKRVGVSAEVDSFGINPMYANLGIAQVLRDAAEARARELKCGELRGSERVV